MAPNLFASVQRWDIEFDIGPEMLKSIMEYMVTFKNEMYIKFFSNRIFIQVVSSDNTQYSEVNIDAEGVQNYNANVPVGEGIEERYKSFTRDEQIKYRNIYVTGEGIHKRVYLNLIDKNPTTPLGELFMFLGKNPIKVRIDTLYEKKIEFILQRGMFIWWRLMDPNNDDTKKVENMPKVVSKIREDVSIGKAVLTMEPGLFKRIANIGGKVGKGGNAHTRALFEADVNKGMMIASGDNLRGRVLKLGVLGSNISDYSGFDHMNSNTTKDTKDTKDTKESKDYSSANKEDSFDNDDDDSDSIIPTGIVRIEDEDEDEKDMFAGQSNDDSGACEVEELSFATSDDIYRNKNLYDKRREERKEEKKRDFDDEIRKEEKKKTKKKDKEDENIMDDAITNDLSSAEVDVKTQMWLEIPFMTPILKLNGLAPIIIEMRNGKPLCIIQRPYPSMSVLLTIAPRIETEDD